MMIVRTKLSRADRQRFGKLLIAQPSRCKRS
jgi:hypothetical protein